LRMASSGQNSPAPATPQSGPQQAQANARETGSGATPEHSTGDEQPPQVTADNAAIALYHEFIEEGATRQINIASTLRDEIRDAVFRQQHPVVRNQLFAQAQHECLKILTTDCFPRFKASRGFEDMLRDICNNASVQEVITGDATSTIKQVTSSGSLQAAPKASPLMLARRRLSARSPSRAIAKSLANDMANQNLQRMSWDVLDWASGPAQPRNEKSGSFDHAALQTKRPNSRTEELLRHDSRDSVDSPLASRKAGGDSSTSAGPREHSSSSPAESNARKRKEGASLDPISESPSHQSTAETLSEQQQQPVSMPTKKISSGRMLFQSSEFVGTPSKTAT
jgi:hypothetical protein